MTDKLRSFLLSLRNRHFLAVDLLIFGITPFLAMLIRLESPEAVGDLASSLIIYTWVFIAIKPFLCWATGLYSRYWPYASVDALKSLALATCTIFVVELAISSGLLFPFHMLPSAFPRSIPLIDSILTILFVAFPRIAVRILSEFTTQKIAQYVMKPVVIAGAGVAGAMVVKELRMNPQVGLNPVAFLDDDPRKQRARIHGVPVAGKLCDLPGVVKDYGARQVIIAMPTAPGKVIRDLTQACKESDVPARSLPGVFEILSGVARISELRDIQIEDLLRRGALKSDPRDVLHLIHHKRVMVTGAGGSIGSELCRQIRLCEPAELVLLGHGEDSIFRIGTEMKKGHPPIVTRSVIADIRDRKRMNMIFRAYQPEVIFHAAAHKHVGLMQANVPEAVTNNILGTRNLVELAAQYNAQRLVMISSDKAVNPTSIMGVTKRIAELVVHDAAVTTGWPFISVRFGNVLGSRGSVVPIFKSQIAAGGPVTVSDPNVTRFFMTIPEAVELVLQAGAMGAGGEVFVLDMGEPIRILDLARDVIRLSGLVEGRDIDIEFTGLKPGEKMYEELFLATEKPVRSRHPKIFVCPNGVRDAIGSVLAQAGVEGAAGPQGGEGDIILRQSVQGLIEAVQFNGLQHVQELIKRIVPEYQPAAPDGVSVSQLQKKVSPASVQTELLHGSNAIVQDYSRT